MKEKKKRTLYNDTKGITLVALVVTLIVLLILAAVSLSAVFSQDGIFSRAEQATDKYSEAKARETLELCLSDAQMKKYESRLTDAELDAEIAKIGALLPKENPSSNIQQVIVGEYIFEIDRSVPKITDRGCVGRANEVIVTASITQNGNWKAPEATVTGTITKYGGGTVVSSTATATNGVTIPAGFPTTGGSYTITGIATDTVITITTTDSEGKTKTHTIPVNLVRDTTPPTISDAKAVTNGLNIKISAKVADGESEVASFRYKITPTTGLSTSEGDLPQNGTPVPVTSTSEETYTVTITAIDNAGNPATKEIIGVKTVDGGVIKHIKLSDGTLKEVNTKDIYGATVNGYTCTRTGVEWQIFYIDETDNNRVYLISKDYMAPPTTGTDLTRGSTSYTSTYYWPNTVLNNYTGTIPNTTFTQKFLSDYANTSASGQKNLQATNYMLDQTKWSEYASTGKSEFVFGGPTLPLFKASYNDICRTANKLDIQKSGTGYQVRKGTGGWTTSQGDYGDTNTQKGIYFKGANNSGPAYGMWLASPSSSDAYSVVHAYYNGGVNNFLFGNNCVGFRPVVSLKSNIQFTSNTDGTVYTIAN